VLLQVVVIYILTFLKCVYFVVFGFFTFSYNFFVICRSLLRAEICTVK